MSTTTIEWVRGDDGSKGETWNPTIGCSRVSEGCMRCYAELMAIRFSGPGKAYEGLVKKTPAGPRWTGEVRLVEERLEQPLKWKKPRRVFVNSMSDLFHEKLSREDILKVFDVMNRADWHEFLILTKRSKRLLELSPELPWARNIQMGVSVENEDNTERIDHLRGTGAHIKFLSLEPLLEPLPSLNLAGIDGVIVGGESGPGARPIDADWVRDIRDQCLEAGVKFHFKQWGGKNKKLNGRLLDGRTWDEMPKAA